MFDQIKYQNDYNKQNYTRFTISIPKDYAEKFKNYCSKKGISYSQFLKNSIDEKIK